MKKIIFSAMAIAAVAVSCQVKDLDENTSVSGESFKISAELPETKTIFNENDKTVAWENNDKLSVVINSASAYTFTKIDGENTFEATNVTLADGTNTFHALYPYNNNIASIDNETGLAKNTKGENLYINIPSQEASSQNAINSTSHIKGVMYGYTEADLTETPSIQMHQLTALLKIAVTNNHTEPITVRSITVSTDAQGQFLSGTFYINLKDGSIESSGDSYTFSSTTLGVTGVTMETGKTGTFWVSANPFSVPVGSHLTISVETDKGSVTDERSYEQALNFDAGTVNTAEFDFSDPKQTIEKLTVAEFLAKEVDENTYYELTGTVSNISSDYHGNFDLVDETGSVYVYGISSVKGAGDKNVLANLGIKAGDAITICGTRGEYGSTVEVMNAYYISHIAAPYCDVTPSSLGVSSEAGTTTFEIKSNESWTIASSNPAYTISPASGDGDATIEVSYPANEGEDAVEVTFTVTSESGEKTVTLTHRSASQTVMTETLSFLNWEFDGAESWTSSYEKHTVNFDIATVEFESADKQNSGSAIDTCPVTKGKSVVLKMNGSATLSAVTVNLLQWGTKKQTASLYTSTDGGTSFSSDPVTTSDDFKLTVSELPEGVNAIQVKFSSTSNQVGIQSFDITYK